VGCWVQSSVLRPSRAAGARVARSGFSLQHVVYCLEIGIQGVGFRVQGAGCRGTQGFGVRGKPV